MSEFYSTLKKIWNYIENEIEESKKPDNSFHQLFIPIVKEVRLRIKERTIVTGSSMDAIGAALAPKNFTTKSKDYNTHFDNLSIIDTLAIEMVVYHLMPLIDQLIKYYFKKNYDEAKLELTQFIDIIDKRYKGYGYEKDRFPFTKEQQKNNAIYIAMILSLNNLRFSETSFKFSIFGNKNFWLEIFFDTHLKVQKYYRFHHKELVEKFLDNPSQCFNLNIY